LQRLPSVRRLTVVPERAWIHDGFLPTSVGEVADELRAAVPAVCSGLPSVRAAYACRTRREYRDGRVTEDVQIAIAPVNPSDTPVRNPLPADEMDQLMTTLALSRGQGVSVLGRRGVSAWQSFGVCLYQRDTGGK
jgi:hypothetical protein